MDKPAMRSDLDPKQVALLDNLVDRSELLAERKHYREEDVLELGKAVDEAGATADVKAAARTAAIDYQKMAQEELSISIQIGLIVYGISQAELARRSGIDPGTLNGMLKLKRPITLKQVAKLAAAFGCTVETITGAGMTEMGFQMRSAMKRYAGSYQDTDAVETNLSPAKGREKIADSAAAFLTKHHERITPEESQAIAALAGTMRKQGREADEAYWLNFVRMYREQNPWPPSPTPTKPTR